MRIHLIGHASLLIETADQRILMDPVFWDPHYEGLCAVCPERAVYPERMPPYSLVVISHRHLDHFDIRTLSSLDRNCPVIIPDRDEALAYALNRLGFGRVEAVPDKHRMTFGETLLVTTPSKSPDREFGLIVQDPTATIWNQVDTAISPAVAAAVSARFAPIDLLIATWQPLLESEVLTNQATGLPYERYFHLLTNMRIVNPRALMPGACGFKYIGDAAWLNKFVFPVARPAFLRDVGKLLPETKALAVNPGDVVEVDKGGSSLLAGASGFVRLVRDDTAETTFDPTGEVPGLSDANRHGRGEPEMAEVIESFLSKTLAPALALSREQRGVIYDYGLAGCVYQLDVVFPSGRASWVSDFGAASITLSRGECASPNVRAQITASALTDLILMRTGTNYVYNGGSYRWFAQHYVIEPHGLYRWTAPGGRSLVDPLWMGFDLDALFEAYIDREVGLHRQMWPSHTLSS